MSTTLDKANLINILLNAEVVCSECGTKYGKYSVGCSSRWPGVCNVCDTETFVTEVRDYGYLQKGVDELRIKIKEQSKQVADFMLSVGPIMSDDELEDALTPSYEQGEITLKLTEDEVGFLNECLDVIQEHHIGLDENNLVDVALFESITEKITDLYDDHCIKYELSPALKAYNAKYGTWGSENDEEMKRWEGFRDAFVMLNLPLR